MPAQPRRRALLRVHMVTISLAIAGSLAYAIWAALDYSRTHDTAPAVLAAVAAITAITLGVYLRSFIRKHRFRPS